MSSRCPSSPRSKASGAASSPASWGARSRRSRSPIPRLTRPLDPADGRPRARRRAGRGARAPRQVPDRPVRLGAGAPRPPAHDGLAAPRAGAARSPTTRTAARSSGSTTAPTLAYRDVRRFGTWLLLEPGELDALPRRARRPRAARPGLRRARARAGARGPPGAAEGGAPRPEDARRGREHLRRRGALAGAAPPAPAGGQPRAGRGARAPPRDPRACSSAGIARQGSTLRDYALPDGARGGDAARVRGLRSRGRAVRPLRDADREDPDRRPGNVVLPRLSAAAARGRRPPTGLDWGACAGAPTSPRRSSSARCATRRPTGSSTSTRASAGGSARSPRACARRPRASARGSSRSRTSS